MAKYYCTLAKKYDPEKHDVLGWSCSEKLDGVRALWDPDRGCFFSRSNKPLNVPTEWSDQMNLVGAPLDGEFFMGRGKFQKCVSAVRKKAPTMEQFEGVKYVVFDTPANTHAPHMERLTYAAMRIRRANLSIPVAVLPHFVVKDMDDTQELYLNILAGGGEGLMFRNPDAPYEWKRTSNLLKWKDFIDGTARVEGVIEEVSIKGELKGRMGALLCIDDELGVKFKVGSGFNAEAREWWWNQPLTGMTIRWRAMERTDDNVPRHPVYAGLHKGD